MARSEINKTKSGRNFTAVLAAFIPFLLLLVSGSIMIFYHINESDTDLIFGYNKSSWLLAHKITALVAIPFVLWHLILHPNWFIKLFTLKLKNKHRGINVALFIVFVLSISTSILSWLVFQDSPIGEGLRGIHSKLGFSIIVLFIFHLKNYIPWVLKMVKKRFAVND